MKLESQMHGKIAVYEGRDTGFDSRVSLRVFFNLPSSRGAKQREPLLVLLLIAPVRLRGLEKTAESFLLWVMIQMMVGQTTEVTSFSSLFNNFRVWRRWIWRRLWSWSLQTSRKRWISSHDAWKGRGYGPLQQQPN
jgi:hypothetical protein